MLIKLTGTEEQINSYNKNVEEFNQQYKEGLSKIEDLTDIFIPYQELVDNGGWDDSTSICPDREHENFTGIYLCGLNDHYLLPGLTNYKEVTPEDDPIYDYYSYGVCDNGTQVLDHFNKLCEMDWEFMSSRDWIITLSPIFRKHQPETDGWRWHKWGRYIGIFNSKNEYLYDETGIDYVYCFNIREVKQKENNSDIW